MQGIPHDGTQAGDPRPSSVLPPLLRAGVDVPLSAGAQIRFGKTETVSVSVSCSVGLWRRPALRGRLAGCSRPRSGLPPSKSEGAGVDA